MKLRDLFESDVTRDIPPVVYFHEQSPKKLQEEVGEYIITGGFPEGHPHHKRVPNGIHEQYVRLLGSISSELEKSGGPELPASWISGFFGSGKSSFAKLLGLALDGVELPDGKSLAESLLARDRSPMSDELREAYKRLRLQVDPISVVFDIGGVARDNEHIHSAIVRQVQKRLGYCADPHVAEMELKLERDGAWKAFEAQTQQTLGKPWGEARGDAMADEDFSLVMSELFPERYNDPMAWYLSRSGTHGYASSVEEATRAIGDMLEHRASGKTLFLVVDEVSQYVHQDNQRMLKLQSFVSDLGQRHKGKVWLLVTGQEKLEEGGDKNVLGKMKDRFPEKLRVHLAATNIRDVVHRRLLTKTSKAAGLLRKEFQQRRNDLRLFAYGCEDVTEEDFVEVYPLLPSHIDLILQITSALRTRSSRGQGDDQNIRGLLQLLGELFRTLNLADNEIGSLVTLDQIYDVQHTALDSDVQNSMARVTHHCATHGADLALRAAKAVALLELIQDTVPTDAKLVASCLYDALDRGSQEEQVKDALEQLRRENLLGYSEKQGYKIQSSSGEEWERERREISIASEQINDYVQEGLKNLVARPEQPRLDGRKFPWRVLFSDGRRAADVSLVDPRDAAAVVVDFRLLAVGERDAKTWVNRSAESSFHNRLLWVVGDAEELRDVARNYGRSVAMVNRYKARSQSLSHDRKRLLLEETGRMEELERALYGAVDAAWYGGHFYFRGNSIEARELGGAASQSLAKQAERILADLFPHFASTQVSPAEVMQLLENPLNAPSPKFVQDLQILELDAGKYVASCSGVIPRRVLEFIENEKGIGGTSLLANFGGPPYGYTSDVVRACVAGLLRAGKVRIQPDGGAEISAVRDAGVREVFEKDRGFKRANIFPAGDGPVDPKARARICKFFETHLGVSLDRENDAIADAVSNLFPGQMAKLRDVLSSLGKLPGHREVPPTLTKLEDALESCYKRVRQTEPTVKEVLRKLDALNDGAAILGTYAAELSDEVIRSVRVAADVVEHQLSQLEAIGASDEELADAASKIREELASERPWRNMHSIGADLNWITEHYVQKRMHLIQEQEAFAEAARQRVKARDGFATLTSDRSHHVLRPIGEATTSTTAEAISPPLIFLRDSYLRTLGQAEEEANERLDALLSEGEDAPMIRKVSINLHNREVKSEEDLDRVLADLKERVLEQLKSGYVRLV
tara:strand:- start:16717 stop:20331 length:3615 start_codon:yes stop_codon:yes gene_type:complete